MNNTKIETFDKTWNPVTGYLHGCEYCYARRIARRFGRLRECGANHGFINPPLPSSPYPYSFDPTFHRYRLDEPQKLKKSQNIFVCSMADLFGEWVPDEWIQEVFKACENALQHRYLFLTKNPKRYKDIFRSPLDYRSYMWLGATATDADSFNKMVEQLSYNHINSGMKTFLSIEPLLEEIEKRYLYDVRHVHWVIIGAETGNRKNKSVPHRKWIESIVEQCQAANVPVFMKNSLVPIMGEENMLYEFPWEKKIC